MQIAASPNLTEVEAQLLIALSAALVDGEKQDAERTCLLELAQELGIDNAAQTTRKLLRTSGDLAAAVACLESAPARQLAYEMALAVCEASGDISPAEAKFLADLKAQLGLGGEAQKQVEEEIHAVWPPALPTAEESLVPAPASEPIAASSVPDNGPMILRYAILNGALELLPETLATMAILPLQMKMVYRVGKSHGVELDRGHIKELLATAGLGVGSQMLEGFARQFLGKLGRSLGGKTVGRLADQAAGSATSFASTYAIGQLADRYYRGGRKLDAASLKSGFGELQKNAVGLHQRYLPEIQQRAQNLNPAQIMELVRGKV